MIGAGSSGAGSSGGGNTRWLVSFADLCLLLLGFFVILHARHNGAGTARSIRAAFGTAAGVAASPSPRGYRADVLFERGEAVLRPQAAARLAVLGAEAARRGRAVRIDSAGLDGATARFDGWELAAARAAAAARAIASGGLAPSRIDIAMIPGASSGTSSGNGAAAGGQTLTVVSAP